MIDGIRIRVSYGNASHFVALDGDTMSWRNEVSLTKIYSVRLTLSGEAAKRFSIVSRPLVYQAVVSEGDLRQDENAYVQGGLHFALAPKSGGTKSSAVGAQRVIKIKASDIYTSAAKEAAASAKGASK